MKGVFRIAAAIAAIWVSLGAMPASAAPAWLATVTATPEGHRLGNPDAKVKLIAYESYTCPHCANFEKEAAAAMRLGYIQPGKMSLEVRHYPRDPVDLTAAVLTECVPPNRFFDAHRAFYVNYDKWIPLLSKATAAQRARWSVADRAAARRSIANDFGFYDLMASVGLSRVQADKCLNNAALADKIANLRKDTDTKYPDFAGTPTFVLNGLMLSWTASWDALRPQIEARL
ncbi:MAG: thioredoxin domain-containing protein [Candidatus Andeanibacterium colombiense]|uniref:Thioredoxin domain-containing protein n=1 Tax=Candidatus Andeanibacterium colombiense TaxID=3121345 RepID=A0AAJ6BQA0_9SPHN|nr:MAG: thioredoxin domain-containing protein [Sphingomonadaceae bacterium]